MGDLRRQIDGVDAALLELFAERCELVGEVQRLKRAHGIPARSPDREREILARASELAHRLGVPGDLAVAVIENAVTCCLRAVGMSESLCAGGSGRR